MEIVSVYVNLLTTSQADHNDEHLDRKLEILSRGIQGTENSHLRVVRLC